MKLVNKQCFSISVCIDIYIYINEAVLSFDKLNNCSKVGNLSEHFYERLFLIILKQVRTEKAYIRQVKVNLFNNHKMLYI